jgi:hypothetical protein
MAIFCVLQDPYEDWGEPADRVKTRSEADARLDELGEAGVFGQIVRWHKGQSKVMARVNENLASEE